MARATIGVVAAVAFAAGLAGGTVAAVRVVGGPLTAHPVALVPADAPPKATPVTPFIRWRTVEPEAPHTRPTRHRTPTDTRSPHPHHHRAPSAARTARPTHPTPHPSPTTPTPAPPPDPTPAPRIPEPEPDPEPTPEPGGFKGYALGIVGAVSFACLEPLWEAESGWNPHADNPTSSAYGIPQLLTDVHPLPPGYMTDGFVQVDAGIDYIDARYGTSCAAWAFFQANGWY